MRLHYEMIYENGVLRPAGAPLPAFREQQRVTVTIDDAAADEDWLAEADPTVSLEAVRAALAKSRISLSDAVYAEREER